MNEGHSLREGPGDQDLLGGGDSSVQSWVCFGDGHEGMRPMGIGLELGEQGLEGHLVDVGV